MTSKKTPILKQIMGAVVGGTLAVGLYYTYEWGSPIVTGYLVTEDRFPQFFSTGKTTTSQKDLTDEAQERISARVRRAINFQVEENSEEELHSGAPIVAPVTTTVTQPVFAPSYEQTLPVQQFEPTVTTVQTTTTGPERVIAEEITTTTTEIITETRIPAPNLPDSGFPIAFMASGLAGSMLGIRKLKK